MNRSMTVLATALVLALAGCNADRSDTGAEGGASGVGTQDGGTVTGTATTADASTGAGMADGGMTDGGMADGAMGGMSGAAGAQSGDQRALMMVMEVDRHEIEAAEAALAKNVQGETRQYAEALQRDHTRNLEMTQQLAGRMGSAGAGGMSGQGTGDAAAGGTGTTATAGATGQAPDVEQMKRKHDSEREQLAQLEGDAFEKAWIDAMVRGHEEALGQLDNELIPGAQDASVREHLQTTRTAIAGHLETARSLQQANR